LTGVVDLRLRLFDAATGGTMRFEETQTGIDASTTCFYVRIGDVAGGIPAAIFANNPSLWIAFALDADPGTVLRGCRDLITNSGYAFKAVNAENAQTAMTAQTFDPGTSVSGNLVGAVLSLSNTHPSSGIGITAQSSSSGGTAGLFVNSAGDLLQG